MGEADPDAKRVKRPVATTKTDTIKYATGARGSSVAVGMSMGNGKRRQR